MTRDEVNRLQAGSVVKRVFDAVRLGCVAIATDHHITVEWEVGIYDAIDKKSPLWLDIEVPKNGAK